MNFLYEGNCWRFGDDVGIDGDMMPLEFALTRELDPEVLGPHFMTGLDPDFPSKVSRGDIIVSGTRFAQGNPHIQGLIGAAAHSVGLVVESIPRGSFRNAVNAGVPILPACPKVSGMARTGDRLRVDFRTGSFQNLTHGTTTQFEPLPESLLETIALGGWKPALERRISRMRAEGLLH